VTLEAVSKRTRRTATRVARKTRQDRLTRTGVSQEAGSRRGWSTSGRKGSLASRSLQEGAFGGDGGGGAVSGVDGGVGGQREKLGPDGRQEGGQRAVGAAGGAGAALEEGVAGEDAAEGRRVEADGAGGMAGGVQDLQGSAGDGENLAVGEVGVPRRGTMHQRPEGLVGRMQEDGGADGGAKGGGDADMVVMGMGAHDGGDGPVPHKGEDVGNGVGGVYDNARRSVTDDPEVVVDGEGLAVEAERAAADGMVDANHENTIGRPTPTRRRAQPYGHEELGPASGS
jgi:hypothetical protein